MKTIKTIKAKTTKSVAKTPTVSPARQKTVKVAAAKTPAAPTAASRREITSELIATRAYILWEQQGRPQGNDVQNWLLAESQLQQEIQSFTA